MFAYLGFHEFRVAVIHFCLLLILLPFPVIIGCCFLEIFNLNAQESYS